MAPAVDFAAAERFIWLNARLLDRRRYQYLFKHGAAADVVAALRPYQNPDGGFGNALEPDIRAPLSQPVPVWVALEVLDEVDAFADPLVRRACDYLLGITGPDGGVPFVLPSVRAYPRGPWWETEDEPPGSLLPTAGIVALLCKHRVDHPWLPGALAFCWSRVESLGITNPYEAQFALRFLEHASDRARAERAFEHLASLIFEQNLVALDPNTPGEVHTPLHFAPRPDSLARRLFSDQVVEQHLAALTAGQRDDGGWTFTWQAWNPATTLEWRAWVTIEALKTLHAYGVELGREG